MDDLKRSESKDEDVFFKHLEKHRPEVLGLCREIGNFTKKNLDLNQNVMEGNCDVIDDVTKIQLVSAECVACVDSDVRVNVEELSDNEYDYPRPSPSADIDNKVLKYLENFGYLLTNNQVDKLKKLIQASDQEVEEEDYDLPRPDAGRILKNHPESIHHSVEIRKNLFFEECFKYGHPEEIYSDRDYDVPNPDAGRISAENVDVENKLNSSTERGETDSQQLLSDSHPGEIFEDEDYDLPRPDAGQIIDMHPGHHIEKMQHCNLEREDVFQQVPCQHPGQIFTDIDYDVPQPHANKISSGLSPFFHQENLSSGRQDEDVVKTDSCDHPDQDYDVPSPHASLVNSKYTTSAHLMVNPAKIQSDLKRVVPSHQDNELDEDNEMTETLQGNLQNKTLEGAASQQNETLEAVATIQQVDKLNTSSDNVSDNPQANHENTAAEEPVTPRTIRRRLSKKNFRKSSVYGENDKVEFNYVLNSEGKKYFCNNFETLVMSSGKKGIATETDNPSLVVLNKKSPSDDEIQRTSSSGEKQYRKYFFDENRKIKTDILKEFKETQKRLRERKYAFSEHLLQNNHADSDVIIAKGYRNPVGKNNDEQQRAEKQQSYLADGLVLPKYCKSFVGFVDKFGTEVKTAKTISTRKISKRNEGN